jgi:hypothetical protein
MRSTSIVTDVSQGVGIGEMKPLHHKKYDAVTAATKGEPVISRAAFFATLVRDVVEISDLSVFP